MQSITRYEHITPTGIVIRVILGDLTEENVDAIVNAANESLAHGGGVAGVISRKGGPIIQHESNEWIAKHGKVKTGTAAITSGGNLIARYVIHAVGPVWGTGDEDRKLAEAIRSALAFAVEYEIGSISMPAISSGIFGFPKDRCAQLFFSVLDEFVKSANTGKITEIRLCNIDTETATIFELIAQAHYTH